MADLRIVDAPEIPTENITGQEKIPTGGSGNYSISLDSLADYTKAKKDLVDTTTVDGKVNGVRQELNTHIEDLLNPHQVTKEQVGLGNVDNTADLDKPVSNSTQAAIISAVAPKADKTYVDGQLTLKADKNDVDSALLTKADKTYVDNQLTLKTDKTYVDSQLLLKSDKTYVDSTLLTKADRTYTDNQLALKADKTYVDSQDLSLQSQINQKATAAYLDSALAEQTQTVNTALSNLSTVASKFYPTLTEANADIANLEVNQPVQIGESANGGLWYKATAEATTLTKSAYDPLTQAKNYVDKTGYASIVGLNLSNINYVTATRTLEFKNTLFVVSGTSRYQLSTPQSVALPENTPYRIECNVSTGLIAAVAYNAAKTEGSLVVGFSTASATTLKTLDFGFTVDGLEVNDFKNNADVRFEASAQSNINYTTADRNLTFSGTVYAITSAGTKVLTTPQVLNLPSNSNRYRIEYNISTNTLRAVAYNASRSDSWAIAGIVTVTTGGLVTSDFAYFVDGVAAGADSQSEYGELLTDFPSRIAFDTVAKTLTMTTAVRVLSAGFTYIPPAWVVVPFPSTAGWYSLVFNKAKSTYSFKTRTSVAEKNDIVLAYVYFEAETFSPTVRGIERYVIDGVVSSSSAASGVPVGFLVAVAASEINFDFKTKQLIIAESRVRLVATSSIPALLPAVTLDISGDEGYIKRLMYNTKTSTFSAIRANAPSTEDEIQVALFCVNTKFVDGVPYYQINGSDSTSQKDDVAKANFLVPYGKLDAEYTQPDLPAYTIMQTETQGDFTKMYALYDALMAQDPSHITKTVLGVDGLGNEIRQYQFSAPEVATVSESHPKKPKIIIFSGVHGYEPTGVFNTFSAMKQIVERWKDDPNLEALYWGVNFIVVPVCNPSGFNTLNRFNHNDVDLARNFTASWSAAQPNSGGSPMSQAETVIMDAVMSNNMDAIYCFSHHNFHSSTSGNFIWNASVTSFGRYLAKTLIIGQTIRAKKRYPEIMPQTNDYYIGYADNAAPPGSEGVQATKIYGIQGGTFEIGNRWFWEAGTPPNSTIVATMGVETLINWLLLNVKYACELYNSRINI